MMHIILIEDESLAAERLQELIERYDPTVRVLAVLPSVAAAVTWLQTHPPPDLAFMDIQLSDGLCFDIFKAVPVTCPIIFTTSYDDYALEAFEVHSVAYLLKPVKFQLLAQSFQKLESLKQALGQGHLNRVLDQIAEGVRRGKDTYKSRFLVRSGPHIRSIRTDEIAYFYSDQKISFLVSHTQQKFPVDFSLEEIEELLDPQDFFRVGRKFITHIDAVKEIHPYFKGRVKLTLQPAAPEEIVVSSERTPAFKAWLDR